MQDKEKKYEEAESNETKQNQKKKNQKTIIFNRKKEFCIKTLYRQTSNFCLSTAHSWTSLINIQSYLWVISEFSSIRFFSFFFVTAYSVYYSHMHYKTDRKATKFSPGRLMFVGMHVHSARKIPSP